MHRLYSNHAPYNPASLIYGLCHTSPVPHPALAASDRFRRWHWEEGGLTIPDDHQGLAQVVGEHELPIGARSDQASSLGEQNPDAACELTDQVPPYAHRR